MCGIYGAIGPGCQTDFMSGVAKVMSEKILYRGPDEQGSCQVKNGFIGANRLSIVDIPAGAQPMRRSFGEATAVIVYNGEIYNSGELRHQLQAKGCVPTTRCDTELVVLAYLVFGTSFVEHLDGQFAFAIWDERAEKLVLGRDPAGIKPLFYTWVDKKFVFGSEPKALFCYPGVSRAPHIPALIEYMLHGHAFASGYVTGARTFYTGVEAVLPGHIMTVADGHSTNFRYWNVPDEDSSLQSVDECQNAVRRLMETRIGDYVSDEVPVGVALSGGVDSSVIAALAAREMTSRGCDVVACSISYEGGQKNEDLDHAKSVAALLRSRGYRFDLHHSVLSVQDYLSELDDMLAHFDEPHWEIKQLAMYRNYRRLKECGAKVVLTGEGADELFFGYYRKFPGFTNPRLESAADLKAYWALRQGYVLSLFSSEMRADAERVMRDLVDQSIERYYNLMSVSASPEKRMQHWYFRTFLPWLLTVNDRCSMAFSLEGRFPFLDKQLIEFAFRMPASLNTVDLGKEVLRRAFSGQLPKEVVERAKAPLPSPIDPAFHKVISEGFAREIEAQSGNGCWSVMSREAAMDLNGQYLAALNGLGSHDAGPLVSYLYLNQPLAVRAPQVFAFLSLVRWWNINFGAGANQR